MSVLTILTILCTALFGIYGSLFDFRNRAGRVTIHGWIGLLGVVVCGISAASLEIYSKRQDDRTSKLLQSEIEKSIYPLAGLIVDAALRPDWKQQEFKTYSDSFRKHLSDELGWGGNKSLVSDTGFGMYPFLEKDRRNNPLIVDTVCLMEIELLFYREPIALSTFSFNISGSGEDLRISVSNPCATSNMFGLLSDNKGRFNQQESSQFWWEFDQRNGRLHRLDFALDGIAVASTSNLWKSNGRVSSLHDLLGAQLIVQLRIPSVPATTTVAEYRKWVHLSELLLRLPNGVVLRFDSDNLDEFEGTDGFKAYAFAFPESIEELLRGTSYDQFKQLHSHEDPI